MDLRTQGELAMTTVFLHGVPDTAAVWEPLRAALGAPSAVALCLPGFGCALPDGFDPSKDRYADWIASALEALPGPRDVIAHDWGSILLVRVLATRPGLVRSWVAGGAPVTADYQWHTTARLWQTPGASAQPTRRSPPAGSTPP
jgi:pimeloyl-ACP methyl ester carboxylesterase